MRILLVEDDELLGDGLQAGLRLCGYTADWLRDGVSAQAALASEDYAAVVLDLGLPGLDGLALLRGLRADGNAIPVLVLTARDTTQDKVFGLDSGADDYLLKPIDHDELAARLRALMRRADGRASPLLTAAADSQAAAARARAIVMEVERQLGFEPTDREYQKLAYDLESRVSGSGKLRLIEVKGRITGAPAITVTRNEILYSLNKPDGFILVIVEFNDGQSHKVHYLRQAFNREPDFGVTRVNYDFAEMIARAGAPQ